MPYKKTYKKICANCRKEFEATRINQFYCSKKCYHKKKDFEKKCVNCGKEFKSPYWEAKYCSEFCRTEFNQIKRPSSKEWRSLVEYISERDEYKCQKCGEDNNLVVHHIVPLADGGTNKCPNLILLCGKCHRDAHNFSD